MLWIILAVALLLVTTASFGPAGALQRRRRGERGKWTA
jgi:hypothetical protein